MDTVGRRLMQVHEMGCTGVPLRGGLTICTGVPLRGGLTICTGVPLRGGLTIQTYFLGSALKLEFSFL